MSNGRRSKRGWGTGLLLAGTLLAGAVRAQGPREITLAEAVALAERNAPASIQARGQTRTSAAATRAAYAAFIPSLSLSASSTRQLPSAGGRTRVENGQVITLPNEPWSYSMGLGATVELFSGGQRLFDLREARARAQAAEVNELGQRFATALAVKQQFFDVLAARESQAAASAQLQQAEQQRRSAVARARARSATRSDSLRAEIQVRNARLSVLDAATALEVANAALTRVVGASEPVTADSTATLDPPVVELPAAELERLAVEGPAVRQAIAALAAAKSARRSSWTAYVPSLSASYSRSGSGSASRFGFNDEDASYGGSLRFSMSLPLFNQLQREQQITQAQVAEDNAEAALRDATLGAKEELTSVLGALRTAGERVLAQTATVAAAEEDLRVQTQRYNVGGSTLLDVLTSQTQLDQARRDLIRARYDQRVAKARLEALIGREL